MLIDDLFDIRDTQACCLAPDAEGGLIHLIKHVFGYSWPIVLNLNKYAMGADIGHDMDHIAFATGLNAVTQDMDNRHFDQ